MRLRLLLGLTLLMSCGDDDGGHLVVDGSVTPEASVPDAGADAGQDAAINMDASGADLAMPPASSSLRLERPSDLPRPPNGRLPADLFPPRP